MKTSTGLMMAAVVALTVVPLLLHAPVRDAAAFVGADTKAAALVTSLRPGYKAWFSPLFVPPSEEVSSLLFALQAALGAGVIGFYFGRAVGRKQERKA